MKSFLLRVGMDKNRYSNGIGFFSPIFNDGTFDFMPIMDGGLYEEDDTSDIPTYDQVIGLKGVPLSQYLKKRPEFINEKLHVDPGFPHFGDWTLPWFYDDYINGKDPDGNFKKGKDFLRELEDGGYIFFYAGLKPYERPAQVEEGLYLIAYMYVKDAFFGDRLKKAYRERPEFRKLSGFRRITEEEVDTQIDWGLAIFEGDPQRSRMLERAIPISDMKEDINGKRYYATSREWAAVFGTELKSIQRSACRIEVYNTDSVIQKIVEHQKGHR